MLTHNDKGFLVHLAREKKVGKFKISVWSSVWPNWDCFHFWQYMVAWNQPGIRIECQRLGLLNQDSSCNIMNYQHVRELPKNVQFCPTF